MSITNTAINTNIYNYPSRSQPSSSPYDWTVTAASADEIEIQMLVDGMSVAQVIFEGQFSSAGNPIGMNLAEASTIGSGLISRETSTFENDNGEVGTEIFVYDPPRPLSPLTTFFVTYKEVASEYAGNDSFIGALENPFGDSIHGYGGDDRFVMTYGHNTGDRFVGGEGVDTAVLPSASRNWTIEPGLVWDEINESQTLEGFLITDQSRTTGNILEISAVEILEFPDVSLRLSEGSWVETDPVTPAPVTPAPVTPAPVNPAPVTPVPEISNPNVSDAVAPGTYSLTAIANVFGSIMFLDGLIETVTPTSHTIKYNGTNFDYAEVDGIITTVVRDGEFTSEFAAEIAESFPDSEGISYSTAVALIGQANLEETLLIVAGADGNYVG